MKVWILNGAVTVSAYTRVEAETLEDAKEIAKGRDAGIHFNGSGLDQDENWLVDEADGEVEFLSGSEE